MILNRDQDTAQKAYDCYKCSNYKNKQKQKTRELVLIEAYRNKQSFSLDKFFLKQYTRRLWETQKALVLVIATFDDPAIFAEELLQGLLGSFSVEPADKELPRSVCLCHATKSTRTGDNESLAANADRICHCWQESCNFQ